MFFEFLTDSLRSAILISGLVVVMMMLIESLNIDSQGGLFAGLKRSRGGQILMSSVLGIIPGCMGGFASVSLYTHGIISFGALVAMMIASSGDEAFVMLALFPKDSAYIFLILFVIAVAVGFAVDALYHPRRQPALCGEHFSIHDEDKHREVHKRNRHLSWKRIAMFVGVVSFIAALLSGKLEHEENGPAGSGLPVNFLSEEWMYWLFGALSLIVLGVLLWGSDHFVEEHLWHHIVAKHLPAVFLWSFGVLFCLALALHFLDISAWITDNTALMIVLAALVGIIPESGPHLIFVTLYSAGIVPLPVLLASCISQDGHASLPLLAESKVSFLSAKAINCAVALLVGFGAMLFA